MVWPCLPSQLHLEGILSFTHANPSILFSFSSPNAPSNFHSHAALSSSKHHLSRVFINDISSARQSVSTSVPTNIARGSPLWHSHSAPCSYLPNMPALCFSDACKGLLEASSLCRWAEQVTGEQMLQKQESYYFAKYRISRFTQQTLVWYNKVKSSQYSWYILQVIQEEVSYHAQGAQGLLEKTKLRNQTCSPKI